MSLLIVLLLVSGAAAQVSDKPYYDLNEADEVFKEFLQKHGKVYNPEEYLTRLNIFKENLNDINERNAKHPNTVFGVNRFTDSTMEERRNYLGFKRIDDSLEGLVKKVEYPAEAITAPDEFDWRDHGAVTTVKDQGNCGASWAFGAIGNIEGQYAIKYKRLISLSAQQGLDCINYNHMSCYEGWPHQVFAYFQIFYGVIKGVASEDEWPYTGKATWVGHDCPFPQKKTSITNITDFKILSFNSEESLKQFLYETGPLAVGLDSTDMYHYKKGILDPYYCRDPINLGVLLVGYGVENGTKYWTLKTSWGKDWGEDGYFRLVRGKNACHMGQYYTTTCTIT